MAGDTKITNINKYKNKDSWNVGIILFGVIFIYLSITVIAYLTEERISVYEVREGSILKDTAFTGLVLREETVVIAQESGYINYFNMEGEKVSAGSSIYTLSSDKIAGTDVSPTNEVVELTTDDWNHILLNVQEFNESFMPNRFRETKTLKEKTNSIIQNNTTQNKVTQLNTLLSDESIEDLKVFTSADDGIIEYSMDGYEQLDISDISDIQIGDIDYTKTEFSDNIKVQSGDPVCRLITSENWSIVIKLTKEMEEVLLERMKDSNSLSVKVRFLNDDETMLGTLQIFNRGEDEAYGYISFSSGMIRYAQERFLDIELILDNESGLKIPKSSVTEKEFYIIPEDYLTVGGSSKQTGLLRQKSNKNGYTLTEFLPIIVYYRDADKGMVYVSTSALEKGDVLIKPEATETLSVGQTASLQGVYNVNKGYAVFKQINILSENKDYYVIEEGNAYSLFNYDHIALDGNSVQENDIVTQ